MSGLLVTAVLLENYAEKMSYPELRNLILANPRLVKRFKDWPDLRNMYRQKRLAHTCDYYLTSYPTRSFFATTYRRYTNFTFVADDPLADHARAQKKEKKSRHYIKR